MFEALRDKCKCAQFLAFVGYTWVQITDTLMERFKLGEQEASDIALDALREQARLNEEDAAKLGKYEAAVEAEHDLDRTTWR